MNKILLYGATGYTGRLTLSEIKSSQTKLVLAGRNEQALQSLGETHGLDWKVADLNDSASLRTAVQDCDVVLHLAGPYRNTAAPVRQICVELGKHYVDITGELSVFAEHETYNQAAIDAGIVLLSGAGFDVVPSDCLINHVVDKVGIATNVSIYFSGGTGMTRGTMRSGLAGLFDGFPVRRNGELTLLDKPISHELQIDGERRTYYSGGWGDLETAWHSSKVPNITCFFQRAPGFGMGGPFWPIIKPILKSRFGQFFLNRLIDSLPEGPTPEQRAGATQTLIAIAENAAGEKVAARLDTPEAYTLTAWTCLNAAERLLDSDVPAGYHTPASAFGATFVTSFPGVTLTELGAEFIESIKEN